MIDLRISIHEYGARGHQSGRGTHVDAGDHSGNGPAVRVRCLGEQPDDDQRTRWLAEESRAYARFRRSLSR
ncbi:MAG TPA: hypothetical protein VNL17_14540 [Verrucomicrobiae bacterium]|nr:hypothetical protein [Verrucomicrobiae bacterium]